MRLLRQLIVVVLVGALAGPAWSEPGAVVGVALNSEKASVQSGSLVSGSTVFSGDGIAVDQNGDARIGLTGGGQIEMLANSSAVLTRGRSAVQIAIQRGSVSFRSEPNSAVEAVMADVTIRAAGGNLAAGAITMESPGSLVVIASKNALEITTARDSKTVLVPEGHAARMTLAGAEPQDAGQAGQSSPPPAGEGSQFHWSGKWTIVVIVVAAGLGTGLGVYFATVSPHKIR